MVVVAREIGGRGAGAVLVAALLTSAIGCGGSKALSVADGGGREDGMTDEIAQQLRAVGSKILRDEAALAWMYGGGAAV